MGIKIREWESHGMCGRFQYCTSQDDIVYHWDGQTWAAMIYLTPDAPYQCGTSLYSHKETKVRHETDSNSSVAFDGGFYDKTKFELVDTVGNVFNRGILFDTTQNSWHGFPEPITCPEGTYRKSIAFYYLTDPPENVDTRKRALYAPYKDQENNSEILDLIKKRSS